MKRKISPVKIVIIVVVLLLLCPVLWFLQPKSEYYEAVSHERYRYVHGYFATETINSPVSEKEKEKIQPVLDRIDYAFSYRGAEEDFPYETELLSFVQNEYLLSEYYCLHEPVAYQELFGRGYLWIRYHWEPKNKSDDSFYDPCYNFSLLILNKDDDGYTVTEIREHP